MSNYEIKYISFSRGEGAEDLKLSMDEARKLYHALDKLFGSEYSMATTAPYINAVHKGHLHTQINPPAGPWAFSPEVPR